MEVIRVTEVVEVLISSSSYGGANPKKVATLKIVNDGSGGGGHDNYVVRARIGQLKGQENLPDDSHRWVEYVYRLEGCKSRWPVSRLVEEALRKMHK
jgi:hypothetical protein